MHKAIETRGLQRAFGQVVAVEKLDLTVDAGTFFGFLGPNGAGKSTTIKMLTGLLGPSAGSARILGHDVVTDAVNAKRLIGVVLLVNAALIGGLLAIAALLGAVWLFPVLLGILLAAVITAYRVFLRPAARLLQQRRESLAEAVQTAN